VTNQAIDPNVEAKPEALAARGYVTLDGAGCVLAASGGGFGDGFSLQTLIGRPIVEVLAEHDGLRLPAGFSAAVAGAHRAGQAQAVDADGRELLDRAGRPRGEHGVGDRAQDEPVAAPGGAGEVGTRARHRLADAERGAHVLGRPVLEAGVRADRFRAGHGVLGRRFGRGRRLLRGRGGHAAHATRAQGATPSPATGVSRGVTTPCREGTCR